MSPAKDLGTKYTCFKCETKFYDLRKPAPICPKCGADQRESPALKAPPSRKSAKPAKAREVVPEVAPDVEEEDVPLEEDAEADSIDEEDDT